MEGEGSGCGDTLGVGSLVGRDSVDGGRVGTPTTHRASDWRISYPVTLLDLLLLSSRSHYVPGGFSRSHWSLRSFECSVVVSTGRGNTTFVDYP